MSDKTQLANYVNGEFVPPAEGGYTDVIDPATGEVYATAPLSTAVDVDNAFSAAKTAFAEWKRTTPGERMSYLLKMADAIENNAEDLVATEARNTGKPVALTMSEEIPPMADQIRFFAGARGTSRARRPLSTCATTSRRSGGSRSASSARSRRGTTR